MNVVVRRRQRRSNIELCEIFELSFLWWPFFSSLEEKKKADNAERRRNIRASSVCISISLHTRFSWQQTDCKHTLMFCFQKDYCAKGRLIAKLQARQVYMYKTHTHTHLYVIETAIKTFLLCSLDCVSQSVFRELARFKYVQNALNTYVFSLFHCVSAAPSLSLCLSPDLFCFRK